MKAKLNRYFFLNESELAAAFAEWRRRIRACPEKFMSADDLAQMSPEEIGAVDARDFIELLEGKPSRN